MTPGVIYLGHIPHGFYENQIRDFFSQFGTVNKVRLSRSKKVGEDPCLEATITDEKDVMFVLLRVWDKEKI